MEIDSNDIEPQCVGLLDGNGYGDTPMYVQGVGSTPTSVSMLKKRVKTTQKAGTRSSRSQRPQSAVRRRTSSTDERPEHDAESKEQQELEQQRDEIEHLKHELAHVRAEKTAVTEAFQRLDREIANGYSLAERKEKELKIAEIVTKNQKLAQMLEKEVNVQNSLRATTTELQLQVSKQQEQLILLNQVLSTTENKHAQLKEAHDALTRSHALAQETIEKLQDSMHRLQAAMIDNGAQREQLNAYESKIQNWERKYVELTRHLEQERQERRSLHEREQALTQTIEEAQQKKQALEKEVADTHDQMIRMNVVMKTMEARIEASFHGEQTRENLLKLKERIRSLESELLEKNRAYIDLSHKLDRFLTNTSDVQGRKGNVRIPAMGRNMSVARTKTLTERLTAINEKLKITEESRDKKQRNLDVLMHAFPRLLQQLDGLQDKFMAATESNAILTNALEQMQQPFGPESTMDAEEESGWRNASNSLQLARHNYLLCSPYQPELLMGYTGAQAFSDHRLAGRSSNVAAKHKIQPFVVKRNDDNQRELHDQPKASGVRAASVLEIAADADDSNGEAFLNRSKINAFLEFIQGRAAGNKFKQLVIHKLAESLTKYRELAAQSAAESSTLQISIQLLAREVDELKAKLREQAAQAEQNLMRQSSAGDGGSRRKLLMKLIDLYVDKQEQDRQSTFLTQSTSDLLISQCFEAKSEAKSDALNLSQCALQDDDLEQLLVKITVSGVCFREIRLDANHLTDCGAQYLATFLEQCSSLQVVSLVGNNRITARGVQAIHGGIVRNPRFQYVAAGQSGRHVIEALAAQSSFDLTDDATVALRVFLPNTELNEPYYAATEESVQIMVSRLQQKGLVGIPQATLSAYHAKSYTNKQNNAGNARTRATMAINTPRSKLSSLAQKQRDLKLQALEAALARAKNSISDTERKKKNLRAGTDALIPAFYRLAKTPSSASASRAATVRYGRSHVATVRGLQRTKMVPVLSCGAPAQPNAQIACNALCAFMKKAVTGVWPPAKRAIQNADAAKGGVKLSSVKMTMEAIAMVEKYINEHCRMTLSKMTDRLKSDLGLDVSKSTVHRARHSQATSPTVHAAAPRACIKRRHQDETHFNLYLPPMSRVGERSGVQLPALKSKNLHIQGGISSGSGVVLLRTYYGFIKMQDNARFIADLFVAAQRTREYRELEPHNKIVIVTDIARAHRDVEALARRVLLADGIVNAEKMVLLRLAPCSPMLNPMEGCWNTLKARLCPYMAEQRDAIKTTIHLKTTI